MGRKSGKSLLKLAQRRVKPKVYVNLGFGVGYYKFRKPVQKATCEVVSVCETPNGLYRWDETVPDPTLKRMGLVRLKNGKIVKKSEVKKEDET